MLLSGAFLIIVCLTNIQPGIVPAFLTARGRQSGTLPPAMEALRVCVAAVGFGRDYQEYAEGESIALSWLKTLREMRKSLILKWRHDVVNLEESPFA